MLKDILEKLKAKKDDDKISLSLIDGYVDVKAYKHEENGEKKLIYHNTGDNTVTNWMRQVIMLLLSGYSLSSYGTTAPNATSVSNNILDSNLYSKPDSDNHSDEFNTDGYCLNGNQYLSYFNNSNTSDNSTVSENFYPVTNNNDIYGANDMYALFPTKILLGTGCEYTDWDSLREFNETDNATWYADIVQQYGNGDVSTAKSNFNKLTGADGDNGYACNTYSGTIGVQGNYTGNGSMLPAVTVNDPDTTSNITSSADMAKRYGVVGAIKTLFLPSNASDTALGGTPLLETTISDSGRLMTGQFRGAGRPCFIYFRRSSGTSTNGDKPADWDKQTSDVFVSKDSESAFLNRITFRVVIPAQSSGTAAVGVYNPFNGYTFKQVGLYNDAVFGTDTTKSPTKYSANMPCGMLLAIKNIQSFTKTADESIEFTWTLTI